MRMAVLCVLALATACTTPPPRPSSLDAHELLFGAASVGVGETIGPLSREDAFGLDEQMRAFVATHVGRDTTPQQRLDKLLAAMQERGLASLEYTNDITRSARATFHAGTANCLSFTILFVALAREAGLRVSYQMVDIPPMWSKSSELLVVRNHINALVHTQFGDSYVVDFNFIELSDKYKRYGVSDEYAHALFYNNLAAEALVRRDYDMSFRYLREAIGLEPNIAASWSNLGLWYSRRGRHEHAEAAYLQALAVRPRDPTVLTNLANLYALRGDEQLAAVYSQRVRAYQQQNPYYHFAAAQDAFEQRHFEAALAALKQALRLKRDEHEFHFLQGLAYLELGRTADARQSFARASAHAAPEGVRADYAARINALLARGESARTEAGPAGTAD